MKDTYPTCKDFPDIKKCWCCLSNDYLIASKFKPNCYIISYINYFKNQTIKKVKDHLICHNPTDVIIIAILFVYPNLKDFVDKIKLLK